MHLQIVLAAALVLPACAGATAPPEQGSPVANVTCVDGATQLLTETVQTQSDGVHFRVDNRTDETVYLHFRLGSELGNLQNLEVGVSEAVVMSEGPGSWELICTPAEIYPDEDDEWVPLGVVDPDALWVPDDPGCEHPSGVHPDYVEDFEGGTPSGEAGDPVDLARADVPGNALIDLLPDDVYEPAGYPAALPRLVRVTRDGRVLAVARYADDGAGRWIFRGVDFCED